MRWWLGRKGKELYQQLQKGKEGGKKLPGISIQTNFDVLPWNCCSESILQDKSPRRSIQNGAAAERSVNSVWRESAWSCVDGKGQNSKQGAKKEWRPAIGGVPSKGNFPVSGHREKGRTTNVYTLEKGGLGRSRSDALWKSLPSGA